MKRGFILIVAIGLLWQGLMGAQVSKGQEDPVAVLKDARIFVIGGFGFAGTTSPPEKALRQLLKRKDAEVLLTKLLDTATIQGQMYALVGLKKVDDSQFKARVKSYTANTHQVRTAKGCIVSIQPASQVANAIAAGQFDLEPEKS